MYWVRAAPLGASEGRTRGERALASDRARGERGVSERRGKRANEERPDKFGGVAISLTSVTQIQNCTTQPLQHTAARHNTLHHITPHPSTHATPHHTTPLHTTPHQTTLQSTAAAFCVLEPGHACHLYIGPRGGPYKRFYLTDDFSTHFKKLELYVV